MNQLILGKAIFWISADDQEHRVAASLRCRTPLLTKEGLVSDLRAGRLQPEVFLLTYSKPSRRYPRVNDAHLNIFAPPVLWQVYPGTPTVWTWSCPLRGHSRRDYLNPSFVRTELLRLTRVVLTATFADGFSQIREPEISSNIIFVPVNAAPALSA